MPLMAQICVYLLGAIVAGFILEVIVAPEGDAWFRFLAVFAILVLLILYSHKVWQLHDLKRRVARRQSDPVLGHVPELVGRQASVIACRTGNPDGVTVTHYQEDAGQQVLLLGRGKDAEIRNGVSFTVTKTDDKGNEVACGRAQAFHVQDRLTHALLEPSKENPVLWNRIRGEYQGLPEDVKILAMDRGFMAHPEDQSLVGELSDETISELDAVFSALSEEDYGGRE